MGITQPIKDLELVRGTVSGIADVTRTTSRIEIRQFVQEDLPAVVEINRTCLPENYPDQFFLGLYYHAPKAFLVGLFDGRIAGYIMCRVERGLSDLHIPIKKGHIVSVAVLPHARRHGLGTALVRTAMAELKGYGVKEYILEVRRSNEGAISVYESLGFEIRRVLKGYYRDGEDGYLMARAAD
ncbi:MAG: ribosomal protein S18-alanine N-acetyltransferase [Candidatus Thorarchaeota archaeon]